MIKKPRRKINSKTVADVSTLGHISKDELLAESQLYDKDNYNPVRNLNQKVVLYPQNKTEVLTIRLTPKENALIKKLADENGLSKSAFLRMIVTKSLKQKNLL
ncbi:plasmid mobilization protein [Desulfitibacter alkalitolerans]|uniref:plasmid mobilization protein n=1 Tax=Desulfitibacter alkalitolerans TaxID=264641 RepID=UPI0004879B28|nr:ribbon-helix-helix domain-containing protein [Desulfitibacter alkalitolerans]